MVKRKRTNNDLQNITQKIKGRATRILLKTGIDAPRSLILVVSLIQRSKDISISLGSNLFLYRASIVICR